MFSYQGSFKKRQASEARRQDHPTCRAPLQNKSFFHESPVERPDQASHGWAWPEPAPHPRHGQEDAASAAPSLPCSQLSQGDAALGSRWSGFHGIPKRRGPRDAGMHPVVFVPQCGVFPTPFPQPLTFPMETKRVPFPGASGLLHSSAAVPCTSVVPQTLRD